MHTLKESLLSLHYFSMILRLCLVKYDNLENMLRILYDNFEQKVKNIHDELDLHHSYKKSVYGHSFL